jgi:hypothetical protein
MNRDVKMDIKIILKHRSAVVTLITEHDRGSPGSGNISARQAQ